MIRRRRLLVGLLILVLVAGGGLITLEVTAKPPLTPAQIAAARYKMLVAQQQNALRRAERSLSVALPTRSGAAAPAATTALFKQPLPARQVIGFAPYYTLSMLNPEDFAAMSVVCYFGLQIAKGGALSEPTGFVGLNSASFSNFVTSAHNANDDVLLTLSAFDRSVIDSIARHPLTTAVALAGEVTPLVRTYGLQGIDIDIEGRWQADRAGFTKFMTAFASAFRKVSPGGIIDVNTFPQSAGTAKSFFNFKALTPITNKFFVMAYAMEQLDNASANSPAISPKLGLSSIESLLQFKRVLPASKTVLGLPFYGYDFSTISGAPDAVTTTDNPQAVTFQAVSDSGHSSYWDPKTETPYTRFQIGTQWHETWYDNPLSIAVKVAIANEFRIGGVGVWALGMEGPSPAMLSALDGGSAPLKTFVAAST